ncbi:heterokaryon incompatibility, partial [Bisporella sp. PMI_857]
SGCKLRVTKHRENGKGDYITLSYCWGGPKNICLRKDNLEELESGIEIHFLPQTFQDAIEVTRKLDIRFLWIDALCILQDDSDDKLKEIWNMGEIYRDSFVTIAAS